MYELIIIWYTGEREVYEYATEKEAERVGQNMCIAFGNQIEWYGTRRKTN